MRIGSRGIRFFASPGNTCDKAIQPPAALQDWLAEVLSGRQPRPRTGTQAQGARDLLICLAVYDLRQRFRISATRNDTSDEESGCDIAAHAFELRYEEVEGIWSGRDPLFL